LAHDCFFAWFGYDNNVSIYLLALVAYLSMFHLTGYAVLLLLLFFAGATPFLLMAMAQVVQIKSPGALKYIAYESGMAPFGDAKIQFDVKFYMYALLFILFDIETVFLFPWAMAYGQLGLFGLVEMLLFVGILALGLVYAWRKGALSWQ
jgi:NAD(P)H-quinone oxidoreductase subunit 3